MINLIKWPRILYIPFRGMLFCCISTSFSYYYINTLTSDRLKLVWQTLVIPPLKDITNLLKEHARYL